MKVKRIAVENVRSFLDRAELKTDGQISILIGPNGGGKTNLLDTIVIVLRRYMLASMYAVAVPTADDPDRHEFRTNDALNQMLMEKNSRASRLPQLVEIEIELTQRDVDNISKLKNEAPATLTYAKKYHNAVILEKAEQWDVDAFSKGDVLTYRWKDGNIQSGSKKEKDFLEYLNLFEIDNLIRAENDLPSLSSPVLYLPVNRGLANLSSRVQLASYNSYEQKRLNDAAFSRNSLSIVQMAIGTLAEKYRLLLEQDKGGAGAIFRSEKGLQKLTGSLQQLGYDWNLTTINALKNEYDIQLTKHGLSFLVGAASSGEKELLTYLFAIYALNIRDAVILVDEPELHLHPKWQKILLRLFVDLSRDTGNQFILATHSPTFVSPESIQYVSRVYSQQQASRIVTLDATGLPNKKHLFNIVNSQNNERIFFADWVILVEGLSDRIFLEAVFRRLQVETALKSVVEIVDIGGKGFIDSYRALLTACQIPHFTLADRDYIEQIGDATIKSLFVTNHDEIKSDVFESIKSKDAKSFSEAITAALDGGNIQDAKDIWQYIQAHRRQLKPALSQKDSQALEAFIDSQRDRRIYLLKRGALEDYLPPGYRGKDVEKLIELFAADSFWDQMPSEAREEIEEIVRHLLATIETDEATRVSPQATQGNTAVELERS